MEGSRQDNFLQMTLSKWDEPERQMPIHISGYQASLEEIA
jgi:hypothetical protein